MSLLERERPIRVIEERLLAVAQAREGSVVFVGGEAGVGKSALARHLAARATALKVEAHLGACDPLLTPRPLGPFVEIAASLGERIAGAGIAIDATRAELLSGWLRLLRDGRARLIIIEDLHWSDEASLDLVRYLSRRITSTSAVLLATYREEDLTEQHPLRVLIGELAGDAGSYRVNLAPLSPAAVAELASASPGVDPSKVYLTTGGNPFFVTEVLASGGERIPPGVRLAVLARAARLSAGARAVLDAAAVVPLVAQPELLLHLAGASEADLDECERKGVLVGHDDGLTFRHEIARSVIESELPAGKRRRLHAQVLASLRGSLAANLAQLVHHAVAAQDAAAILELAPRAAARASSLGAHREATAFYGAAARAAATSADRRTLAEFLDLQANEAHLAAQHAAAMDAQRQSLAIWRELREPRRSGAALRLMSRVLEFTGEGQAARRLAADAVDAIGDVPCPELAAAYHNRAQLAMASDDFGDAREWADRAHDLSRQLGDEVLKLESLVTLGAIEVEMGDDLRSEKLDRAIASARASGQDEALARALLDLAAAQVWRRQYLAARTTLGGGLALVDERGLEAWRRAMAGVEARLALETGDFKLASELANKLLAATPTTWERAAPLVVLGRVRARRGDPGVWPLLDQAWTDALGTTELQVIGPAATARLEAAWLGGERLEEVKTQSLEVLARVESKGTAVHAGELAVWLRRTGVHVEIKKAWAPWSLELAGDWGRAEEHWLSLGCPYEAAMAVACAEEATEEKYRDAVARLQRLGAMQAAKMTARRLRDKGARGLPRGARASTLVNPMQLTRREVEVLGLLAEGLTSAEIGTRLFVSVRTIDHHVEAILTKLAARNRASAVREAQRRGVIASLADSPRPGHG